MRLARFASGNRHHLPTLAMVSGLLGSRRLFLAACVGCRCLAGTSSESVAVFAERRRRLADQVGRGVIALLGHSNDEGQFGFSGFRQESNFFYLTGHSEPGAALLIAPARRGQPYHEVLFLPERRRMETLWHGPALDPRNGSKTGFKDIGDSGDLPRALRRLLKDRKELHGLRPRPSLTASRLRSQALFDRLQATAETADIRDLHDELASMRCIKSPGEVAALQAATDATVSAFRAAWSVVRDGVSEQSVSAELAGEALRRGCDRLAFPPMAGTGSNATVLHYTRNRSVMKDGQLLLIDAGGEKGRYAADIARTIPVSGRFSARQRALYEAVLGAQQTVLAKAHPGMTLNGSGPESLQTVAERTMRRLLPRGVAASLPHALGHHVGLDVHDPAPRRGVLREGMVVAIEPGLYLPNENLGIRVEDMLEITADGCRVMSAALPKKADAIEDALANLNSLEARP